VTARGTPQTGSQRGGHHEQHRADRAGRNPDKTTHRAYSSDSDFRGQATDRRGHRHADREGSSSQDRRYGSRRGHGSERRTERRPSSH
jgi:hypothetical protein